MTDLKTANEQLAQALKALESLEHDADVREAEACRNRLMELDERIGARIKAKLEAHKAIADAWGKQEPDTRLPQMRPLDQAAREPIEHRVLWGNASTAGILTTGLGVPEVPAFEQIDPTPDYIPPSQRGAEPDFTADAWTAHHEEHTGKYALAGEQVPDRVMVNGVAEMQQAAVSDEQ